MLLEPVQGIRAHITIREWIHASQWIAIGPLSGNSLSVTLIANGYRGKAVAIGQFGLFLDDLTIENEGI